MGCATSTETPKSDSDSENDNDSDSDNPLVTHFHDELFYIIYDEVPLFLERHCEIKTGAYVEWTTLVNAFDVHMSNRYAVYIECKKQLPWMITSMFKKRLLFNFNLKAKEFIPNEIFRVANNLVTGISLVSFPTPMTTGG